MNITHRELIAAITSLPIPDLLGTSSIDDAPGEAVYYSAATVVRLLADERCSERREDAD